MQQKIVCSLLFLLSVLPSGAKSVPDTLTVANNCFEKRLLVKDKKVYPLSYKNKRTTPASFFSCLDGKSEEFVIHLDSNHSIKASDLDCTGLSRKSNGSVETYSLGFLPYYYNKVHWDISLVYVSEGKDVPFYRQYLLIKVPEKERSEARIDYIDYFHLSTSNVAHRWTHPQMANGVGGVSGYYIALGQPVYLNGLYFGSEFPATENEIDSTGIAHVRYYSGKTMKMLGDEHRLDKDGAFRTWNAVVGATRSADDMNIIQQDFFGYINHISTPDKFRLQYNSWYDHGMDIDETNILGSFKQVEKGLTQNGVPPIDSYVVDDGWNAYDVWGGKNKTHFWEFNSKFPNGLTKPASFAHAESSNFGLWLGPRGGYNYFMEFAKLLEKYGNGKLNKYSSDIVTGHKTYLQKLQDFFISCQEKYKINYWKWDGFMVTPPQPDPQGMYISGGYRGMYYVTEHWERWINLFKAVRKHSSPDLNLWLNLTCYINPSPWYLQWCNSMWIQNSGDVGRVDGGFQRDVDRLLSYRDDRYFDFAQVRQFQFPLNRVYNHDPVFGVALYGIKPHTFTDEEFRTYLYMMATRGNAFWELYYSPQLLDGSKWLVNAAALSWAKANYPILSHARLIGNTPAKGHAYGFASWKDNEGIISVRNPSTTSQDFSFTLNKSIGVKEGLKGLHRTSVLDFRALEANNDSRLYAYGDTISLHLQPGEAHIWKFSTERDVQKPYVTRARYIAADTLRLYFNEQLKPLEHASFAFEGTPVSVRSANLLPDYQTVEIVLNKPLVNKQQKVSLSWKGVKDLSGNEGNGQSSCIYYPASLVLSENKSGSYQVNKPYETNRDFSIACTLRADSPAGHVFSLGKDVSVSLDNAGHVSFRIKGQTLASKGTLAKHAVHKVVLLREVNGMLKIYLDGQINASCYHPSEGSDLVSGRFVKIDGRIAKDVRLYDRALGFDELP